MLLKKKLWRNERDVCVIRTHATQTKQIHNILPRSNNSFRSSFARPGLLPCKLSPRAHWTRPSMTDIFQVDCLETISFFFLFLSTEIPGPVCHTSKQLTALWSYWKIVMRSSLWHNNAMCQHRIECWLGSHLSEGAECFQSWLQPYRSIAMHTETDSVEWLCLAASIQRCRHTYVLFSHAVTG